MNTLRVAVFHNLPSGGAKRALHSHMRLLHKMGHKLDLYNLTTSEEGFVPLAPFAEDVFTFPLNWTPPRPRANLAVRLANLSRLASVCEMIAERIDNGQYDVAFVHHCRFVQSPLLLSRLKTPSVYYCEEPLRRLYEPPLTPYELNRPASWGRTLYRRYILSLADRVHDRVLKTLERRNVQSANLVLANSYYSRETLYRTFQVDASVNYLGVDAVSFRPLNMRKENWVLSVGALHPRKAHDFVIRALSLIRARIRPRLVVVADRGAAAEAYLKAYATAHGVDLKILLRVSDDELVELYNRAEAMVYAPLLEPFGLAALEAMACGTPVIGVKEAGIRETVRSGETGILTERSEEDFAQALETLLLNKESAHTMGRQARSYVSRAWTWERSTEELVRNFHRAVNRAAKRVKPRTATQSTQG